MVVGDVLAIQDRSDDALSTTIASRILWPRPVVDFLS